MFPRTKTLEQVQAEYRNQLNGDTADDQAIAIGRGENPLLALSGAVRSLGANRRMFNAAFINVESGVQERGDSANYNTIEEGVAAIRTLSAKLTGVMLAAEYRVATPEAFLDAVDAINREGSGNYTIILTDRIFFGFKNINSNISFAANGQKNHNHPGR